MWFDILRDIFAVIGLAVLSLALFIMGHDAFQRKILDRLAAKQRKHRL